MSVLTDILAQGIIAYKGKDEMLYFSVEPIAEEIKTMLLEFCEEAKDQSLPLTYVTKKISEL